MYFFSFFAIFQKLSLLVRTHLVIRSLTFILQNAGKQVGYFLFGKLTKMPFFEMIMLSLSSCCSVVEVHREEPLHEHADIVEEPSCFNQTNYHISKGSFKQFVLKQVEMPNNSVSTSTSDVTFFSYTQETHFTVQLYAERQLLSRKMWKSIKTVSLVNTRLVSKVNSARTERIPLCYLN